jgi:ribosomal protein L29
MRKKMEKLKGMDGSELDKKLTESRESIRSLRFKMEGAKSKNVKESGALRKEIARILTIKNQKNQEKQNVR